MKRSLLSAFALCFIFVTGIRAQAPTLTLYGMTYQGGDYQNGNLFQLPIGGGLFQDIHSFGNNGDASQPLGSLIVGKNGLLYGMTKTGGSDHQGAIFSFNTVNDTEKVLHSFIQANGDGLEPYGSLLLASDGMMYGLTIAGGGNTSGAIIRFDPATDSEKVVYSFTGGIRDGQYPAGSLIQANDTLLYGLTRDGGIFGNGVLFSYNIADSTETVLHHFSSDTDAANPWGSLLQAHNGLLYGMSNSGGVKGFGTIFSYNITTGKDSVVHSFALDTVDGGYPYGSLIEGTDSLLYGLANSGGTKGNGILFSFNTKTGTLSDLHNFTGIPQDGVRPQGSLLQASDGKLYGMASAGGNNNDGIVFSYNPADSSYFVWNFNGFNGYQPVNGALVEYNGNTNACVCDVTDKRYVTVFPNPSSGLFTIHSFNGISGSTIEIYNVLGEVVYSSVINSDIYSVNIGGKAKGVYFYRITGTPDGVYPGKIVVE